MPELTLEKNEICEGELINYFKCIIWYSEVKELFDIINNKIKKNEYNNIIKYITQLCNCNGIEPINNMLYDKFIFTKKDIEKAIISNDDINFIEGYFGMSFLLIIY